MRRTLKLRTALFGLGAALMLALAAPNIASAANTQTLTNAPPTYQAYLPGIAAADLQENMVLIALTADDSISSGTFFIGRADITNTGHIVISDDPPLIPIFTTVGGGSSAGIIAKTANISNLGGTGTGDVKTKIAGAHFLS